MPQQVGVCCLNFFKKSKDYYSTPQPVNFIRLLLLAEPVCIQVWLLLWNSYIMWINFSFHFCNYLLHILVHPLKDEYQTTPKWEAQKPLYSDNKIFSPINCGESQLPFDIYEINVQGNTLNEFSPYQRVCKLLLSILRFCKSTVLLARPKLCCWAESRGLSCKPYESIRISKKVQSKQTEKYNGCCRTFFEYKHMNLKACNITYIYINTKSTSTTLHLVHLIVTVRSFHMVTHKTK